MNRERAKKLLPIIQAFADGKDIQCKGFPSNEWVDIELADFIDERKYRIKPEPQTFWLNMYRNRASIHGSRVSADEGAGMNRIACIKRNYFEGEGL